MRFVVLMAGFGNGVQVAMFLGPNAVCMYGLNAENSYYIFKCFRKKMKRVL